jgi:hypothetical protein
MCQQNFSSFKFRISRRIAHSSKLIKTVTRYRIKLTGKQMHAPNVIVSLQMLEALSFRRENRSNFYFQKDRNETKVAAKSNCVTRFLCFFGCFKQAGELCHSTKLMSKQKKRTLLHLLGRKQSHAPYHPCKDIGSTHTHTPDSNKISSFKMSKGHRNGI